MKSCITVFLCSLLICLPQSGFTDTDPLQTLVDEILELVQHKPFDRPIIIALGG